MPGPGLSQAEHLSKADLFLLLSQKSVETSAKSCEVFTQKEKKCLEICLAASLH